jgi:ribosomal protein S18 acetylase RimI-like enzyme
MYITSLSVDENMRNNGIATTLLHMSENIASFLSRDVTLYVKCGTWMLNWYYREGYK